MNRSLGPLVHIDAAAAAVGAGVGDSVVVLAVVIVVTATAVDAGAEDSPAGVVSVVATGSLFAQLVEIPVQSHAARKMTANIDYGYVFDHWKIQHDNRNG